MTALLSNQAIVKQFSAPHLVARQENAQNVARALGMLVSPTLAYPKNQEAQLSLDLLPHRLQEKEWRHLENGLIQVARTFQSFLQDIYSEGKILKQPHFPFKLVLGHPDYQRDYRVLNLPDQLRLRFIAVDLVKENNHTWHIANLHLDTPSGIAYALQNRRIQSQIFPELREKVHVFSVSQFPAQLLENLQSTSPDSTSAKRIALLSEAATRHDEFEHSFLARKMGIILAKCQDLIVRDNVLHYKTIAGLQPIHTLLQFSTHSHLDPVTSGKPHGIAGLFQSWRSGMTQLINPLGNRVAENRALFPWFSEMTHFYLQEAPILNTLPTFLLADPNQKKKIQENPENYHFYQNGSTPRAIKNPNKALKQISPSLLAHPKLDYETLSCLTKYGALNAKPFILRCFILIDRNGIEVMPGGLTKLVKDDHFFLKSPYVAKDTWIVDANPHSTPHATVQSRSFAPITDHLGSRPAESLYWLGRYAERAECIARMFSVLDEVRLESTLGDNPLWQPLWEALSRASGYNNSFLPQFSKENHIKTAFHITFDSENAASLLNSVQQARQNANSLQDYIPPEAWSVINRLEQTLTSYAEQSVTLGTSAMIAIRRGLETALNQLASFRGMVMRTMLQDTGNGFFYTGLYLERILMTTVSLQTTYASQAKLSLTWDEDQDIENPLLNAFLRMMGTQDAYHRKYQQRAHPLYVAEMLLTEKKSPASLNFCLRRLTDFFTRQIQNFEPGEQIVTQLSNQLNEPIQLETLNSLLENIFHRASELHNLISDTFFQHQPFGETHTFNASFTS
ncbi:MAG: circularly permuted type 2 ATP-grasp protein [Verrucomicrobiia bacterium]